MEDTKDEHSESATVSQRETPLPKSSTDTTTPLNPKSTTTNIMEIDHRTDRSLLMAITHAFLRPFGPIITKMKQECPPGSPPLDIPKHATTRAHVAHRTVNGVHIYDMTPKLPHMGALKSSEKAKHKRIYYFAGGGWRMPASADHWALTSKLAASCPNTTVSLVSYPLAPLSPAPDSIPILLELLPILLNACAAANETVILAGDSAGANLVLALPLEMLRAAGEENSADSKAPPAPMPAHILVLSPSTDLRRCNPDIPILERKDPLLRHKFIKATSEVWRGDWPAEDTRLSPLLLPLETLVALRDRGVQVHGITGGYDILAPDALLFRDRLVEAGVGGSWLHWEKQMHVYPLAWRYGLRESRQAKDWAVEMINKKM